MKRNSKDPLISIPFNESGLMERNEDLGILLEMSNYLSSSLNLKDLLTGALEKILRHLRLDSGRVYLPQEEGDHLQLIAHVGLDPTGLERVSLSDSFSGKAFQTKSLLAQYVSELEDKDRAALLIMRGFQVVICVPLIVRGKAEGVMNLTSTRAVGLDRGKVDLLTTLGNQMAVAANNVGLNEELHSKIEMLQKKEEMIKFFAYSVSHDLKSPATALYGLTRRLKEKHGDLLDEKATACCDQILKTAAQMLTLVEKVNAYIAAKEAPLVLEKVPFKEVTMDVRNEFAAVLEERGIRWTEPESMPQIIGDRLALTRVLRNLVDNALKYGGNKMSEIQVGYRQDRLRHILSLTDDGVGITGEDREKIFGVFQRNHTSKGITGCGLGLAIVREIAERHGGCAWIHPEGQRGATFCISISKDLK